MIDMKHIMLSVMEYIRIILNLILKIKINIHIRYNNENQFLDFQFISPLWKHIHNFGFTE